MSCAEPSGSSSSRILKLQEATLLIAPVVITTRQVKKITVPAPTIDRDQEISCRCPVIHMCSAAPQDLMQLQHLSNRKYSCLAEPPFGCEHLLAKTFKSSTFDNRGQWPKSKTQWANRIPDITDVPFVADASTSFRCLRYYQTLTSSKVLSGNPCLSLCHIIALAL